MNTENKALLGTLVLQLLDDDYGISNDAYMTLQELCESIDPVIMNSICHRVRSTDNRTYLKSIDDDDDQKSISPSVLNQINHFNAIKNANADTLQISIWSVSNILNINEIAFSGVGMDLVYICNFGTTCQITLPENPTWLDMWKAADLAIRTSGDLHHIYIEQFRRLDDATIELITGS